MAAPRTGSGSLPPTPTPSRAPTPAPTSPAPAPAPSSSSSATAPLEQWTLVRVEEARACAAHEGTAQQETVDGEAEVFQVRAPRLLLVCVGEGGGALERAGKSIQRCAARAGLPSSLHTTHLQLCTQMPPCALVLAPLPTPVPHLTAVRPGARGGRAGRHHHQPRRAHRRAPPVGLLPRPPVPRLQARRQRPPALVRARRRRPRAAWLARSRTQACLTCVRVAAPPPHPNPAGRPRSR